MKTTPFNTPRSNYLLAIRERIIHDTGLLKKIINRFEAGGLDFTADDIKDEFFRVSEELSLFNLIENNIRKMILSGRLRTSETYRATLNSFRTFLTTRQHDDEYEMLTEDIKIDSLTSDIMEKYQGWLQMRGLSSNTISFYCRILRAVYNRAVEMGLTEDRHPFRHVYTGVYKTVKRALPLDAIRRIKRMDLSQNPALDYARDIFILSFYLRGMSFIDMAFLRKSDLRNGYITYRRRKTGQKLIIMWTKEMQTILEKYPENRTDYLFPIIRIPGRNERTTYRNAAYRINSALHKISLMAGIRSRLTLYVARHSWASAAKAKRIPISVISEGLGHDSETTTQIYLASLDTSVIDKANSLILASI